MKSYFSLLLISLSILLSQCISENEVTPEKVDYDAESIKLMTEIAPQIIGKWDLKQVAINTQSYNGMQRLAGITKDTVFRDFATLDIRKALIPSSSPQDFRHPDFEATIEFRGKSYPASFTLMANGERVIENKGPQAFFLFQFNHPPGSRTPVAEETFLENLGVMDNYSLELISGQPTMVWKGLNRGVDKIILQRQ